MTEHGGGRDSDRNSADSWFRPSQNRHRKQSEYQDPLEEQREEEDRGTVFPDSGGYAGPGSARPEMVDPYPEALAGFTSDGPQTPSVPEEPEPSPSYESQNPFVYPGAREVPHRPPVETMPWEEHGERPGGYPNVAASADVPAPPGETEAGEWPSTGSVDHDASLAATDPWAPEEPAPEAGRRPSPEAWSPGEDDRPAEGPWSPSYEPSSWHDAEAGARGSSPPSSDRVLWTVSDEVPAWGGADAGPQVGDVSSYGSEPWSPSAEASSWGGPDTDPLADGGPSSDLGDPWTPSSGPSSWDAPGSDPLAPGAASRDSEPWSPSAESSSWDAGADPLGPGAPAPVDGEHWPPADHVPSWGPSSEREVSDNGGPSGGSGSWNVPGTDPLEPSTPRGESWTPSEESPSWGIAGTGGWSSSDPLAHGGRPAYGYDGYGDELSGSAGPGSWGAADDRSSSEDGWGTGDDRSWSDDGYDDELSGPRPAEPQQPDELGTGSGNTWAFSRDDHRLPDAVRQAEQRRREEADGKVRHGDWGGSGSTDSSLPASDDPLAALADLQSRAGAEAGPGPGSPADGGATQMFGAPPVGEEQGASTQMFSPLSPDGPDEDTARPPAGVPSDLGSVPSYGRRSGGGPGEDGYEDGYEDEYEDEYEDYESEYEDGFTPADYGMPEKPRRLQRRRRDIREDFPGFDDRPPGGEPGDGYPGYDSVDFLADTEPGANLTLWLGVASLVPFVGVITALLALLVTGPKAKREIRDSRGELDGHGRIMAGTVLAVAGIVVTVTSLAITLIL
ncbi:hypothetical protein GCM10007147_18900 [Nocardiopsis kunsanensis]|uniref:DUF4190 domain-containing protein n=1 Tax=Nocardiopsis kunsanensis TaxID=141693 RepID=A0A918XBL8_9ACTN|nr:hypothetical protein [Nocardiopsis kunsanensis]GHD23519.1 hypothetical protein GCM10007147_18900 [Nocardiopsis kunsanensis]